MPSNAILHFFLPEARSIRIITCTDGNINGTWIVHYSLPGSADKLVVLQRLNPAVFPDPHGLMENFRIVTRHLAEQREARGDTPLFPRLLANPSGRDFFLDTDGSLWRMCSYIGPARVLHTLTAPQAGLAGDMLAHFHLLSKDIASDQLTDPLPGFHDTPGYLTKFDAIAAQHTPKSSVEEYCFKSISSLRQVASLFSPLMSQLRSQVVHADPKNSNFLFAQDSEQILSLIDLDTVRYGYILHDLGDCLRSSCNRAGEESDNPTFSPEHFTALLAAYLTRARHLLSKTDEGLLLESASLLIFELGLRFFTDHLQNNVYFKVHYPAQNLHRALVQFRLHASLMAQESELQKRVKSLLT